MLLHESRRNARVVDGELIPLAERDRSRHDRGKIDGGRSALDRALALQSPGGPYVLQAAIASLQAEETGTGSRCSTRPSNVSPARPSSRSTARVAIAKVGAPERALELVDSLDLDRYRYLHSTRAELLRSLGLADEAREAYARALHLATSRCGKEAVAPASGVENVALAPSQGHERPRGPRDRGGNYDDPADGQRRRRCPRPDGRYRVFP